MSTSTATIAAKPRNTGTKNPAIANKITMMITSKNAITRFPPAFAALIAVYRMELPV